jgi:hypothetical protein
MTLLVIVGTVGECGDDVNECYVAYFIVGISDQRSFEKPSNVFE